MMESLALALGWTLLHSLWQVASIAGVLALALHASRQRSAELRYLFACTALVSALAAPVFTFAIVYEPRAPATAPVVDHLTEYHLTSLHPCPPAPLACEPHPYPERMAIASQDPLGALDVRALEPLLPYLALGWIVGVALLSLRLFALLLYVEHFKRRHCRHVPTGIQTVLETLCRRLDIRQRVRALESSLADGPLVIGILEPVILIPASALTGLTMQQLESILAHELAHIRRHDYLVNLLQNVAETLLFYHPAVWWMSHQIRAERERACDDMAVAATGNLTQYVRALAQLEALRQPQLALAASGGSLVERIRRLVAPRSPAVAQSWLTSVGVLLSVLVLSLALTLPQWVAAQERYVHPRPHLWATMFGLTVRLNEDATAVERIPSRGYIVLEERVRGQRRKMTVTQARSGEFAYLYELDGTPQEVGEEALEWYEDAFTRSIGYVYSTSTGDTGRLSYRSFVRGDVFTSVTHLHEQHQIYEIVNSVSRRGMALHDGKLLTRDDPRFETYAEQSVLNDIGRVTHLAAHDLVSYHSEVGDALVMSFVHDVLAQFKPTLKLSRALLDLTAEMKTDRHKAAALLELAPSLRHQPRLLAAYRAAASTLVDGPLRASVLHAIP